MNLLIQLDVCASTTDGLLGEPLQPGTRRMWAVVVDILAHDPEPVVAVVRSDGRLLVPGVLCGGKHVLSAKDVRGASVPSEEAEGYAWNQ